MSYALALNSTNVTGPNNSIFQYTFASGSFVAKDAEIALSSASIPYSWSVMSHLARQRPSWQASTAFEEREDERECGRAGGTGAGLDRRRAEDPLD